METKICKVCGRELPIENFKSTRSGSKVCTCTECATKKLRENKAKRLEEKKDEIVKMSLQDFTARQLMEELARRGYTGTLDYTRVEHIDITNF